MPGTSESSTPTYQRAKQSAGSRDPEARRQTTSSLPPPWWPRPTPPAGRSSQPYSPSQDRTKRPHVTGKVQ